jgi:hypothetical protein
MDGEAWSISSCADRDGVREDKSNLLFSYRGAGLKTGTRTACFGFGLAAWPWRARAGCGVFVMLMLGDYMHLQTNGSESIEADAAALTHQNDH